MRDAEQIRAQKRAESPSNFAGRGDIRRRSTVIGENTVFA
jgi:hypothetical protein